MFDNVFKNFNANHYQPEQYSYILEQIREQAGDPCVRMSETPVFISKSYADKLVTGASEIIKLALSPTVQDRITLAIPPEFDMPSAPARPSFFIIDFAVTQDGPRLIELQAFASNLLFAPLCGKLYKEFYHLEGDYQYLFCDVETIRRSIMGSHPAENVVLMEINPWQQPSRRDFVITQKRFGVPVVDIKDIIKKGRQLYYLNEAGRETRIMRIYNRVVPGEYQKLNMAAQTTFRFSDDLDVEWAGDPSWFLRVSKYVMPFLKHPLVPKTQFLDQVATFPPPDPQNYVLKPAFLNAGAGVKLNITQDDLMNMSPAERHNFLLMQKVTYMPFIPDLAGQRLNAEIRVMFVWTDKLQHTGFSARVMRGNDVNSDLYGSEIWCGMAPVFVVPDNKA